MSVNVVFRTDEDVKKGAESIFKSLGLNMSNALNMFLHATIRHQTIPFSLEPVSYSPDLLWQELGVSPEERAQIEAEVLKAADALPVNEDGASIVPSDWFDDDDDDAFYDQ